MRPIFCGNFDYDARQSDLERLFRRYGRVERVDMKSGFAFIYMEDERDAEDAIRGLDRVEFGRKGRRLRVEWSNQERGIHRPGGGGSSRRSANTRPSKTLFVINFDPQHTRIKDLERHFDPYGKIVNVRIRRNFAFVQYELQEDATEALEATNMSKLLDRVISVEYAVRDDDEKRDGYYSPGRTCDRSPDGRSYGRRRSPSPCRRERGSPDYGRGPSPGPYRRDRASTDYGRHHSPSPYRRERASPDYGRASSHSPARRERAGSDYGRVSSPYQRARMSPDGGHDRSPYQGEKLSPCRRERAGSDDGRVSSPYRRERMSPDGGRDHSPYPANGHGPNCSPFENERADTVNGCDTSRNPYDRNEVSPDNDCRVSPNSMPDEREIPNDAGAESPMDGRDNSQSPLAADD